MTPEEFKEARLALGLTKEAHAREWGVAGRTVRRWEAGDAQISGVVAYALRLMLERNS